MRVGRGSDEIDQPSSWAGAVTLKPPVNAKKAKRDLSVTDRQTDRQTDRVGHRVACTRLKRKKSTEKRMGDTLVGLFNFRGDQYPTNGEVF